MSNPETSGGMTRATAVRGWSLWMLTGSGLALIAVCYGFARFAYGMFVPEFRSEFALTSTAVGLIAAGSYAAYCVAIIAATALAPRWGGRTLAVAAGAIATGGVLLVALAPNAAALAVGVLVAGSSTGVASPPLAHAVAHSVAPASSGRVQTVINAGTGVGVAVAGPIALITHDQWRAAWVVFAAVCLAATVWAAVSVPSARGPAKQEIGGKTQAETRGSAPMVPRSAIRRPLAPHGSGALLAASVIMGCASSAVWTFGRDALVTVGGMDERGSAIAWIFLGACGVLGGLAGDVAHRIGIARGWTTVMVVLGAATVMFVAFPHAFPMAAVAAGAFGAAYIALTGLLLVWGTHVFERDPATGVGLAFLLIAVGQAVGSPLIGSLIEAVGTRAAFMMAAALTLAGALVRPRHVVSGCLERSDVADAHAQG